jgi:hypothetical protein
MLEKRSLSTDHVGVLLTAQNSVIYTFIDTSYPINATRTGLASVNKQDVTGRAFYYKYGTSFFGTVVFNKGTG